MPQLGRWNSRLVFSVITMRKPATRRRKLHILLPALIRIVKRHFPTQNSLDTHLKNVHNSWVPFGCDEEDCDSTEIFQNRGAFVMHRQNFHSDWFPRQCPVPECPERKTFEKRNAFVGHLTKMHPQQKEEFMPSKTKKRKRKSLPQTTNWTTTRCLYPGCVSDFQYTRRDTYVQHLRTQHGIYIKDAGPYMPTTQSNE
jgi:hypothetical protein